MGTGSCACGDSVVAAPFTGVTDVGVGTGVAGFAAGVVPASGFATTAGGAALPGPVATFTSTGCLESVFTASKVPEQPSAAKTSTIASKTVENLVGGAIIPIMIGARAA